MTRLLEVAEPFHAQDAGTQDYRVLTSRNAVTVSADVQERIRTAAVLFVGCGLASRIAEMAVRLGFTRFHLWDGDCVELSNLNRQSFARAHLGRNKAEVTAEILHSINPHCCCHVHPRRMKLEDVDRAVENVDLVINTADFDEVVFAIGDRAAAQRIPALFTLNLGFGGACLVFMPESARLAALTGGPITDDDQRFLVSLGEHLEGWRPSQRFRSLIPQLLKESADTGYFAQNIVAASITAALVCHAMVRLLDPDSVRVAAPRALHFDPDALYE